MKRKATLVLLSLVCTFALAACDDPSNKDSDNGNHTHTASEWIIDKPASCTQSGNKHKECTVCFQRLESDVIAMLEHTASDWIVDKPADHTQSGNRHKECTVCFEWLERDVIPMLDHTAQDIINDAREEVAKQNIQNVYYDSLETPLELLTTTKNGCKVTYSLTVPSGEVSYTTNTTVNGANMIEGNNAESIGLPATIFTVTGDKGSQNNLPWIAPNSYRLYSSADGNGSSMNFAVAADFTIKSVKFTFAEDSKPDAVAKVTTGTVEVTGTNGLYVINNRSFTVQNVVKKASTQLRFRAIEIVVETKVEQDIKLIDGNKLSITVNPNKPYSTKLTATISLEGAEDIQYSWDIETKPTANIEE